MTPQETLTLIGILAAAYPRWGSRTLKPDAVEVWATVLAEYEFGQLKTAAVMHIREDEFPPTIAGLLNRTPGASVQSAVLAWAEVERAYDTLPWRTPSGCSSQPPLEPEWEHPATHEALNALGGWFTFFRRRADGESHFGSERKAFLETFDAFKRHTRLELLRGSDVPQLEEEG